MADRGIVAPMIFSKRGCALCLGATLTACAGAKSEPMPAATAAATPASSATPSAPIRVNLGEVSWADAPPTLPAGAKIAVLEGDPRKPAFFTMRMKLPAGARLAPHTHPADERVTVVSGSIHVALGDKFDASKGQVISAGGFYVNPTPVPHFVWAEEECVIQVTGIGPWGVNYLDSGQK
jgi:quercetin dioxygenase-like cupin family protein